MSRLIIAQASVLSLPALHRLFARAVQQHFTYLPATARADVIREHSPWKLLRATADRRRIVLTARQDGRMVGYAIGAAPASGPAQLFWLYVEPSHRGSNIGLSLLSRMLKMLGERGAHAVSIATHDHRRYYERQGFKFKKQTTHLGVTMDILTFRIKQ